MSEVAGYLLLWVDLTIGREELLEMRDVLSLYTSVETTGEYFGGGGSKRKGGNQR